MKLKYVVFSDSLPVVFGGYFKHSDFSRMGKVTSAGFCSIREIVTPEDRTDISSCRMIKVTVWGESTSLGVKSDPDDARLLENMYNKS